MEKNNTSEHSLASASTRMNEPPQSDHSRIARATQTGATLLTTEQVYQNWTADAATPSMPIADSQVPAGHGPRRPPDNDDGDIKSEAGEEDEVHKGAPWRALFAFTTKPHIPLLLGAAIASAIAGAASPALYLMAGNLFTAFTSFGAGLMTKEQFVHDTTKYVLYFLAISGVSWAFHSLQFMLWLAFGELQAKSARDRLFHGLLEKEIAWYDMRKNGIGALLPRVQAQIRELQLATAQPMGSLACLISTSVLSLVQALVRSWDLTLVTLATVPLILALAAFVGRGMQPNLEKQQDRLTEAQKFSASAFSAIETVKCFNGQLIELEKYKNSVDAAAGWFAHVANAAALQMALVTFLSMCMFVQGFYYGSLLVARGKLSSGDVVTTFFSALTAFQSLEGILPQMIIFEKGRTAGSTLRAIMAQIQSSTAIRRTHELLYPSSCIGNIDMRNVSFAYPSRPDQYAIKDITLYIQGGGLTFLIGKSGSGKSTVGQLLMRFYASTEGQIWIDDIPLQDLDTNWLRSNITLVEQSSLLFNESIYRNIALGRKDHENVNRAEVMVAVEFALLQLMVNDMPEGLDTQVGFKGGSMSGGQRQRIALARARIRDTPVLILDESTSALDHVSRTLIMEAIRQWRHGKTTIIITHDISQILPNDYVYVLENGKMAQEGYRKNMEKAKNSPIQGFLFDKQSANVSGNNDNIGSKASSIGALAQDHSSPECELDPLETTLTMTEERVTNPISFFPNAPVKGTPVVGSSYGAPGTASPAYESPWIELVASSASDWSSWAPKSLHPLNAVDVALADTAETPELSSRPLSQVLEKLIDRTGKIAADARLRTKGHPRGRPSPGDSMTIPLTRPEALQGVLKADTDSPKPLSMNSLKYIFRTIGPSLDRSSKAYLILGFWAATIHAVSAPAFSYVLSLVLATYSTPGGDKQKSLKYSMIILAIAAVNGLSTWLFRFLHEYIGLLWVDKIRYEAFEHVMDQSREFFEHGENGVSTLTGCLDHNAEEMRNLLGRFASLAYVTLLMILVSLLWTMSAQWKMSLISLALAPFIFAITKMYAKISEKWESHSNDASEIAAAIFTETFTNIKTVRGLTLEPHFLGRYITATEAALRVGFQRAFYAGFFYGLSDSAGNFGVAVVFYVGARQAEAGAKMRDIIQVFTMLTFLIGTVTGILAFIPQVGSSKDTAARLLRLAKLPKDSHEHLGDTRITNIGDVIFDNLSFSYPCRPGLTVLKGINLRLQLGTTTAIVGSSGSGKSTIANLLLALYSTASLPGNHVGDLTFGGRDIRHISTSSLRSLVVPVSQTPTLFAATVTENITYGLPVDSPHRSAHSIETAARQAGIHDFITSLPSGYDTLIGDGGMGLSGGQAQRVAIARALVRKPSVLILDEATSALDVESANLVRHTIKELIDDNRQRAMTIIIITHHRDMMEIAERIVVLDQGRIAEEGSFGELVAKDGALAHMLSGGEWDVDERRRRNNAVSNSRVPILKDVEWSKGRQDKHQTRSVGSKSSGR